MELDDKCRTYLKALAHRTDEDTNRQASMFDIGAELNLDRNESQRVAEMLMAEALVEIRNLSGAIAITRLGIDAINELTGDNGPKPQTLCTTAVLDEISIRLVEMAISQIKIRCGNIGLEYEALAEMIADLKTIDTQLFSPYPKTVIIREALSAIRKGLNRAGEKECCTKIGELLGD